MDDAGGLAQVAGELQPSWEDKYCRAKRPDDTIGLLGMLVDFLDQNWERYHRMCLMSYDALSTWRRRMSQPQKAREISVRGSEGGDCYIDNTIDYTQPLGLGQEAGGGTK